MKENFKQRKLWNFQELMPNEVGKHQGILKH